MSVAIANFFPFEYHSVLCSPYEAQFLFHKAKNSNGEEYSQDSSLSVQRNDGILAEGWKNIRENQGKVSEISLKISGEVGGFFQGNPEFLDG